MRKPTSKTGRDGATRSGSCGGFTLIEVLITMLVISVGILGIAVMQMKGLQFAQGSFERSIAVAQANDLADRLWTRLCGLSDPDTAIANAELEAVFDAWVADHSLSLPAWNSILPVHDTTGDLSTYRVVIGWSDSRAPEAGADAQANFEFAYYAGIPVLACP